MESNEGQGGYPFIDKENSPMRKLENKVVALKSLKDRIDSFTLNNTPEQVQNGLLSWFDLFISSSDPKVVEKYQLFKQQSDRADYLAELKGNITPEQLSEAKDLMDWVDKSMEDDEVRFLHNLEKSVKSLIDKNRRVHKIVGNSKQLEGYLQEYLGTTKFRLAENAQVKFTPFSIILVLNESVYNKYFSSGSVGSYIPIGSGICVIKDLDEATNQDTIDHEQIHNLLEYSGVGFGGMGVRGLRRNIHQLIEANKTGVSYISRMFSEKINEEALIKGLLPELLAALDEGQKVGFTTSLSNRSLYAKAKRLRVSPHFYNLTQVLSTAGHQALDIVATLDENLKTIKDEQIRDQLVSVRKNFITNFEKVVDQIKASLGVGFFLGKEADISVHALLNILNPLKYHHIERYLTSKYSQVEFDEAKEKAKNKDINAALLRRIFSRK